MKIRAIRSKTPVVIKPKPNERSWRGLVRCNHASSEDSGSMTSIDESMDESMTSAERARFLTANNGDMGKAMEQLRGYFDSRNEHQGTQWRLETTYEYLLKEHGKDYYDWVVASETAKEAHKVTKDMLLPQIVSIHTTEDGTEACDLEGYRVLHFLPAQIDKSICSLKTYTLALFLYLDRKLSRESMEQITILMDLRPGAGWANPKVYSILPFIEDTCSILMNKFPERMHNAVIYPLPYALTCVLRGIVKNVLDTKTANKLSILSGSAGQDSPYPKEQLLKHVDGKVATMCEEARLQAFK